MAQDNDAQAKAEGSDEGAVKTDDSLINPGKETQTLDERLDGASSPADVMRLIEDAKAGRFGETTTEERSPAENPEAAAGSPGGEQNPPEEGAKPDANGAPAETPEAGTETKPEGGEAAAGELKPKEEEAEEKLPDRIRLSNFSKVEKLALTLKRENPNLSLAQAEAKAKDALGIKDEAKPEAAATEASAEELPKTPAETDAKIAELVALRTKASKDFEVEEADKLTNRIEALREHKRELRDQGAKQASDEQRAYDEAYAAAEAKAAALYDFMKQADSDAFKRLAEIDRQLEANNDPLFHDPNKPLVIAQMVAKEQAIAPKSARAPAKAAAPAVKAPAVKKTIPPVASGASRTTTASTQGGEIGKKIERLRTPQDIENFLASNG